MNDVALPLVILWLVLGAVKTDRAIPTEAAYHAFGGQTLNIDLAVESPGRSSVEIRADLFQKGQSLLATLQKDVVVAHGVRSELEAAGRVLVSWELAAPEVKRETQILARLKTKTADGEWASAGQFLLVIYPPGFAKEPLAAFAKGRGFHVFGRNKNLRGFLKTEKTSFEEAGDDLTSLPETPDAKGIYLGETTAKELAEWQSSHPGWRGNLVVFCSDSPLLPGVFVTARGGSRTAKVTLPLLNSLSVDPRSQKTFLEILNTINQ